MKLADLPGGANFLDIEGIPVVRLPDASCVAFATRGSDESRPYVAGSKVGHDGDPLTRDEFESWLKTSFNRFDVRR